MRFSLRSVFLTFAVIAVGLALVLYVTKDYRERMAIRASILSHGASFARVNPGNSIGVLFTEPVASPDIARYGTIETIEFKGIRIESESLGNLTGLEHVDVMLFQMCTIDHPEELTPLSRIGGIHSLLFWNTSISDTSIDIIATIRGIKVVDFFNTLVTKEGVDRLRKARPEIEVFLRP
jgi:hypothetical protein